MTTVALTSQYSQHLEENPIKGHTSQIGDHQSIFKYVSLNSKKSWDYFEDTISNFTLTGSTSRSLNDPFEISPCEIDDLDPDIIRDCHTIFDKQGFKKDVKPLSGCFNSVEAYRELAQRIVNTTVNDARILAFSDKMDSPLLWAHYANSYREACLHFIGKAFANLSHRTGLVSYARQRPFLPLSLVLRLHIAKKHSAHSDVLRKLETEIERSMFFTKPEDWAYEGEFRVAYSASRMKGVQFDRACLLEVIMGCRMSEEDEAKLRALLEKSRSSVKIRRAKPSDRTFGVDAVGDE